VSPVAPFLGPPFPRSPPAPGRWRPPLPPGEHSPPALTPVGGNLLFPTVFFDRLWEPGYLNPGFPCPRARPRKSPPPFSPPPPKFLPPKNPPRVLAPPANPRKITPVRFFVPPPPQGGGPPPAGKRRRPEGPPPRSPPRLQSPGMSPPPMGRGNPLKQSHPLHNARRKRCTDPRRKIEPGRGAPGPPPLRLATPVKKTRFREPGPPPRPLSAKKRLPRPRTFFISLVDPGVFLSFFPLETRGQGKIRH